LSYRFPSREIKAGKTKETVIAELTPIGIEMNEDQQTFHSRAPTSPHFGMVTFRTVHTVLSISACLTMP
jgi:hypothetical protein